MQPNEVGWDPTMIDVHIDFITKLAVIYLSVAALVLACRICHWWAVLGFSTVTKTHQLRLALNAIEDTDGPRLRAIGRRFSRWSLHRGLRQWALPENAISRRTVDMIVRQAAEQFHFQWSRETSSVDDLSQWIGTTKLALAILSITEVTNLLTGAAQLRSLGNSVAFGALARIGQLWIVGLWLILAMYLAHWCFSARLARQREGWQRFEKTFRSCSGTTGAKTTSTPAAPSGSNPNF
jgi:hypothetical protein